MGKGSKPTTRGVRPAGKNQKADRSHARARLQKKDWRREYHLPPNAILRASMDLLSRSICEQIQDHAGRMFALRDLIDNEDMDNIAVLERESDEPAFIEIVRAVRREALSGQLEYARSLVDDFLNEAFRMDSATLRLWVQYQDRMRQRRIDAGLGLIDPPDRSEETERRESGQEPEPSDARQLLALEVGKHEIRLTFDTESGPVEIVVLQHNCGASREGVG
ncbi:MAG: hypothetical protein ACREDR_12775 [Blastocatellia bacterium]